MTFITIVGCALGAYIALWAVYLPIAYHFNSDAERDPDDEPIPPWLPELLEMGQLARPMGRGQFQVVHRPPAGVARSKRFTRWVHTQRSRSPKAPAMPAAPLPRSQLRCPQAEEFQRVDPN